MLNQQTASLQTRCPRYIPVKDWKKYHPWPTEASLRWYIFNAGTNGFDKVIVRIQHRVLIDEAAFFAWVEENKQRGAV